MTPRNIFVTIVSLAVLSVFALFLIQPGRYEQTQELSQTTQKLNNYLSQWEDVEKATFADCALGKTNDDQLTQTEAIECATATVATE